MPWILPAEDGMPAAQFWRIVDEGQSMANVTSTTDIDELLARYRR